MIEDLTVGKPETVLWKFCLPLLGSILFQQLYNIADSFVAGKFIGENALAAVGNSYEITLIFIAFAFGCSIGCSVIVSQYFGAGEYGKMRTAVFTAFISGAVICSVLMLAGIFFSDDLLHLIKTPADVFGDSELYLDIYVWGLPFVFFYNISTGIFSALGDSKTPFAFLAVSSMANIAVDILFVKVFSMGVAGVALATFLCQGISCILAVTVVLRRLRMFKTEERTVFFSSPIFRRFVAIAVPSILQQSFISVGNIIIQGVINGFGTGVMAGFSAAVKLNSLVTTSLNTLGNGVSNFTAQNFGANKLSRIKSGFSGGLKLVWSLCLPICVLYFFGGGRVLDLFISSPTDEAIDTGIIFLRIVSPFYLVVAVKLVADGVLRGVGMMKKFMAATFTDLIIRVALAVVLSRTALGSVGIWCAWPIGWIVSTVLSVTFYRSGHWNKIENTTSDDSLSRS